MESKNKNSILIIIIAILSVLVIILGAFIYYDKVIKKDNNIMVKEKCSVSETKPEENEIKGDVEDQNKETNDTNQSNNISTNEKNNIVKKYDRVIPDDNCPLTIFYDNYILTDTDKEQIVTSLESLNAGFNRDIIDINSFTIASVSSSGTYMNVRFDTNPKTSNTFASVTKINGSFKVLIAGSGDTAEGASRMESTLIRLCK